MTRPFIIFALPRSRTAWLAHFLSYDGLRVGHDIAIECESVQAFLDCFGPKRQMIGTVETGAILGWRLLRSIMPELRMITIRRRVWEVECSLAAFGIHLPAEELVKRSAMLDALGQEEGVRSYDFAELREMLVCKQIFEDCIDTSFDYSWWSELQHVNIQVDMDSRMQQLARRAPQIEGLKRELFARTRALMRATPAGMN